jgi:two-component system chemotaxis response regulator CheY
VSKTILCVDDSPTIRMLLQKTLEPLGFQVVLAENGQDGVEKAKTTDMAMIIMDVNMPVMGGFDAVKAIKALPGKATVPVVFLTTENAADKKQMGKDLGVQGWIVKPFEPASLEKVITALVG